MIRHWGPYALILAAASSASAQQWTAVRLHPPGGSFSQVYSLGAGQQGGFFRDLTLFSDLPVIWRGTSTGWTPLASGTGIVGEVLGMWEGVQVGELVGHAALWLGTPESRVDLELPGMNGSAALAVRGQIQAGWVSYPPSVYHAALWRGTAASFVDLHPAGALRSYALATDGVLQGGYANWQLQTVVTHATLWNGSAQSFVDLNPAGASASYIRGMAPGVQVGEVYLPLGAIHAALWHGTPASWVDLNPPGGGATRLFATTGAVHVGQGVVTGAGGSGHAIINFGAPNLWLDLHQFLPPGYTSFSAANAVFQDGPTIYVGGYAYNGSSLEEAFLWIGTVPCYANCDGSTTAPALNVADFSCFLNAFAARDPAANCDQSTTPPVLNVADFGCFLNRFATGCL